THVAIPNVGSKRPRLDQDDANAERACLHTKRFAPALEGELGSIIGADNRGGDTPSDRRNHDDVTGALPAHDRQHRFSDCDLAEEVGFELAAQLVKQQVFGKAGGGETGIVDQHVQTSVIAVGETDKFVQGIAVGNVEAAYFNSVADSGGGGSPVQALAAGGIAHAGDDAKACARQ